LGSFFIFVARGVHSKGASGWGSRMSELGLQPGVILAACDAEHAAVVAASSSRFELRTRCCCAASEALHAVRVGRPALVVVNGALSDPATALVSKLRDDGFRAPILYIGTSCNSLEHGRALDARGER